MPQSGTVTLMFSDLVNSAALLQQSGDETGADLFRVHHKLIAEAISALFLRARRTRDAGRDDTAILRQACELQQGSVFACRHPNARPMAPIEPAK